MAIYFKYSDSAIISGIVETVSRDMKVDEAVAVISNEKTDDVIQVFGEKEKSNMFFDEDYYVDEAVTEVKEKSEVEKKHRQEEEKKLSVEALSFSMSEEELFDDTEAKPFKIPPPSSCSYEKKEIKFKYTSPLRGVITSLFGYRDHPIMDDANFHTGLDIAAKSGSTIVSFADGKVIDAGKNNTYGNYLLIEHSGGMRSFYGHNSKLTVKKGQKVKLGQKIAEVGSTGMSTGPHLHFEIRSGNIRLDPSLYISPENV